MSLSQTAALPRPPLRVPGGLLAWLVVLALTAACLAARAAWPWLVHFPAGWGLPVAAGIDLAMNAVANVLEPASRAVSTGLAAVLHAVQSGLHWLPWPVSIALVAVIAFQAGGWSLALFCALALGEFVLTGFWRPAMSTLALVVLAVPVSVAAGFALGAAAFARPRWRRPLEAVLDVMQTVPAFAYLIPLLLLFGFGPVVGLISAVIYATPPMTRCTLLGLQGVPDAIVESAIMSGCTKRQSFWRAELPAAREQLLIGVNQTTMATLGMVIVAAVIGGFDDIGWAVLSAIRKAEFGQSLLAGVVIALEAMVIDRITLGFALRSRASDRSVRLPPLWFCGVFLALLAVAVMSRGSLDEASVWLAGPHGQFGVDQLNAAVFALVRDHGGLFGALKNTALYYVLLPLRIGLAGAISPYTWGFALTAPVVAAYVALMAGLAAILAGAFGWRGAVGAAFGGCLLFFGFAGFPWPAFIAATGLFAWQAANRGAAILAVLALAFVLLGNMWGPFMLSLYLCGLAVLLSVLIGGGIGVLAAESPLVSRAVRPVCDTLQTMPQFVFLIPVLMLFKVGEFTALIAIMLYAIVPPIRYVEAGLRQVPPHIVEAAQQMGCTRTQMLLRVKLPLALPLVMLGINQTIAAGLSMLAIAAMVGTKDLGQEVYIALSKADAGRGAVAGLSIALIAIVCDRIICGAQAATR